MDVRFIVDLTPKLISKDPNYSKLYHFRWIHHKPIEGPVFVLNG
jgi:hypothetical protein